MSAYAKYYDILGVKPDSSLDVIKQQYRKMSLLYHPDKNQNSTNSEELFKLVNEAYTTLSDFEKKKIYDSQIKEKIISLHKISDKVAKKRAEAMYRELFGEKDGDMEQYMNRFDDATYDFLYSVNKKTKSDLKTTDPAQQYNPFGVDKKDGLIGQHEKYKSEISTVRESILKANKKVGEMQRNHHDKRYEPNMRKNLSNKDVIGSNNLKNKYNDNRPSTNPKNSNISGTPVNTNYKSNSQKNSFVDNTNDNNSSRQTENNYNNKYYPQMDKVEEEAENFKSTTKIEHNKKDNKDRKFSKESKISDDVSYKKNIEIKETTNIKKSKIENHERSKSVPKKIEVIEKENTKYKTTLDLNQSKLTVDDISDCIESTSATEACNDDDNSRRFRMFLNMQDDSFKVELNNDIGLNSEDTSNQLGNDHYAHEFEQIRKEFNIPTKKSKLYNRDKIYNVINEDKKLKDDKISFKQVNQNVNVNVNPKSKRPKTSQQNTNVNDNLPFYHNESYLEHKLREYDTHAMREKISHRKLDESECRNNSEYQRINDIKNIKEGIKKEKDHCNGLGLGLGLNNLNANNALNAGSNAKNKPFSYKKKKLYSIYR